MGLKVPISIGWDYGGLLGTKTSHNDLTLMVACSNWSLKELKMTFLYSIEYAIATAGQKINLRNSFNRSWEKWVNQYIS